MDLTSVGMGPYCTQILADMGADVVKIESREGDVFRFAAPSKHHGMGATFLQLNRNKRALTLDVKHQADLATLRQLIEVADVFISNVRLQSLRKLGLAPEQLTAELPRLIYCGVYGFSARGPYADRPAFDDIIQAMSGSAALQGQGAAPAYVNTIIADKTTGLTAAYAISMALYERERSGQGQAIEVPMFETMVSFNLIEHMGGNAFIPRQGEMGYERVLSPHRRPYPTRDGYIGLLPYTDKQWQRFFTLANAPQYLQEPRFATAAQRSRHINELYAILAELVQQRSTAEWVALLEDADIPMAPVAELEDLINDPHLKAIDFFPTAEHPTQGTIRMTDIPVRFSRTPGSIRSLAPQQDQDHEQVLNDWLGAAAGTTP